MRIRTTDLAYKMDVKPQNISSIFNSPDVPSGKLEAMARALGKDMSFWYPEIAQTATYHNTGDAGRDINQGVTSQQCDTLVERIIAENKQLQDNNNMLTTTNAQLSQIITNLTRG